ncbi:hypothetical protein BKA69DRAFT_174509 [Paraphysoderma sedebokerense]|nr:hypothetical protein BKA69DRAFT_174509 [Paraphysoderma sedebokerense]
MNLRYEGSDIFSVGSDEPTQRLSTRILRPGGTGGISSIVNSQAEVDTGKTASEAGHDNAAVNRQSHVMEDGDFALNGFSGRQINQKRYETSDIFNAPAEPTQRLSTRILRPGGTGGASSIINNVDFESHREAVKANHDHATANRESHFMEEGEQTPSITGKQINQKRYETNDIFGSEPESSQRLSTRILRPGGTGGQSSFDYMQVERPPSGTQRKHFSSRETNSTFEPSEKPLPKKSSPEFETHIGQSDAEIHPPTKKPNPMLEATVGKDGSEVERPIKKANPALETTLDKPLPPPVAKPQFELQSHLAPNPEGGLLPTSSTDEPVAPNPTKYVSRNLNSHVFPTDPSSTSSVDPAFVPEDQPAISRRSSKDSYRTNRSSFTLSTGSDFEYQNRPSTKVSEYNDKKKSSVILGDDGGEIGIVPKQEAKTISDLKDRSERSRAPPGGRSSISFF